jgi:CDP-glucose 4,6-dehydratase
MTIPSQPFNLSTSSLTKTFSGKKVLVTGHTGFKGSWLCQWLIGMEARVSGFSLPEPTTKPSLFEQLGLSAQLDDQRGDIRDGAQVSRLISDLEPDFVFHLAAQPLVRLSYEEPVKTWETNVFGTMNVLEALKELNRAEHHSSPQPFNSSTQGPVAVFITTDKVYENREWDYGYREDDALGGYDPYSSSKAAAELVISSWRRSYFGSDYPVRIASVRAGNVIGGGDWSRDRIVPDAMRGLSEGKCIAVRNPHATRPWQHVLEPLSGYLSLAAQIAGPLNGCDVESLKGSHQTETFQPLNLSTAELCSAFNFGPHLESNRSVEELIVEVLKHWPGEWEDQSEAKAPHEAGKLNLTTDKAYHSLGWKPRWGFEETIQKTVEWYRQVHEGVSPVELTRRQIEEYIQV